MKILGISCYYHDSAASLLEDDNILAAAHEERFSRIKGDENFPHNAIRYCLESAKITLDDVDAVVFYEKPLLKFERIIETYFNICPKGLKSFLTSMPVWLQKKVNQKKLLKGEFQKHFNTIPANFYFSEHHLSHAASAFFPSPFKEAAVLCMDGVGEWATTTAWVGKDNTLTPLWEIKFPHSLGLLYSTFTHYCGFKVNSGEYKLMGLAPFGKPVYADLIKQTLIKLLPDGSFWLNTDYFGFLSDLVMTNKKFEELFKQPPRSPESEMTDFYKDIAASIQMVLNEAVMGLIKRLKKDTQLENICLAGGVALNCVSNGLVAEAEIFKNMWIQPAAGDAGGSLGAALAFHFLRNSESAPLRRIRPEDDMRGAYLGPDFSDSEIEACLKRLDLTYKKLEKSELLKVTAQNLSQNKVVGWFQGRMEFGPRALGARSILANAAPSDMKSKINMKIKFREGFRPFAPIVTAEDYDRYFSLKNKNEYMLLISKVKDTNLMPAITHVDGTARVQVVSKEKNFLLHSLLKEFENLTSHPILINTSFNVRGEPIVCSPDQTLNCFFNTDIDTLVIGSYLVKKEDNLHLKSVEKWHEQYSLD